MGKTEKRTGGNNVIGGEKCLALVKRHMSLDKTLHRIFFIDTTVHAAGNDRKITIFFTAHTAQDWNGQEMIGIKRRRRIA